MRRDEKATGCITHNCQGKRVTDRLCGPCFSFITSGCGTNNQIVMNASSLLTRRFNEKLQSAKLSAKALATSIDEALALIFEKK